MSTSQAVPELWVKQEKITEPQIAFPLETLVEKEENLKSGRVSGKKGRGNSQKKGG